jgi:hypothetical protein
VPLQSWAYNPKIKGRHRHDPERARRQLDDIGWKVGGDGIRVNEGKAGVRDIDHEKRKKAYFRLQEVLARRCVPAHLPLCQHPRHPQGRRWLPPQRQHAGVHLEHERVVDTKGVSGAQRTPASATGTAASADNRAYFANH